VDSLGNYLGESAWSGSGGGISRFVSQPSYQAGVVTQSSTLRTSPDVAYDANPSTGFPVFDSFNNGTVTPWSQFGGTSAGAPQWAALVAIADQGRVLAGLTPLDGPGQLLPKIYTLSAQDFHDITTGSSTGQPTFSAGPGYDLVTGRGSPFANRVVADLVGAAPRVAGVVVNGGAAQRSRVTDLTVTFSTQVSFATTPGAAFTLTRNSDGAVIAFTASASVVSGVSVVTLSGFAGAATQFGSLADGDFTLTTLANQVSAGGVVLDGNGDGHGGDNNTQSVFRLFGDINGDRRVDIADFALFSSTFNLSIGQPGFNAAYDFNGDGRVDIADFGQFSVRFFTMLP
jgi:hypothetical protein